MINPTRYRRFADSGASERFGFTAGAEDRHANDLVEFARAEASGNDGAFTGRDDRTRADAVHEHRAADL
jgi:hypothetical protein